MAEAGELIEYRDIKPLGGWVGGGFVEDEGDVCGAEFVFAVGLQCGDRAGFTVWTEGAVCFFEGGVDLEGGVGGVAEAAAVDADGLVVGGVIGGLEGLVNALGQKC